jgi:hypothetical protein
MQPSGKALPFELPPRQALATELPPPTDSGNQTNHHRLASDQPT